jgi:hypothetical protein
MDWSERFRLINASARAVCDFCTRLFCFHSISVLANSWPKARARAGLRVKCRWEQAHVREHAKDAGSSLIENALLPSEGRGQGFECLRALSEVPANSARRQRSPAPLRRVDSTKYVDRTAPTNLGSPLPRYPATVEQHRQMISRASTSGGPLGPAGVTRSVNPRAEPRSRCRTSAFRWRSARCADNKQESGDSLPVPRSSEQKAVMPSLTLRGTASVVACLVVRPVGENQPTADRAMAR